MSLAAGKGFNSTIQTNKAIGRIAKRGGVKGEGGGGQGRGQVEGDSMVGGEERGQNDDVSGEVCGLVGDWQVSCICAYNRNVRIVV